MTNSVPGGGGLKKTRITATIANGQSLSGAIEVGDWSPSAIEVPSSWTAAGLTLQASWDDSTWFNVNDGGAEFTVSSAAAGSVQLIDLPGLAAFPYLKIRSGTASVPVAQGDDRIVALLCIG